MSSSLASKNRHALILLDSTLEIAFKDFLMYVRGIKDLDATHAEHREVLHRIVRRHVGFEKRVWDSIDFFYARRCNLYHEDASSTLTDDMVFDFFNLVIWVIDQMFGAEVQGLIIPPEQLFTPARRVSTDVNKTTTQVDALLVAIGGQGVADVAEILDRLGQLGYRKSLAPKRVGSLLANASYRHLFHRDAKSGRIGLSDAGAQRYKKVLVAAAKKDDGGSADKGVS